MRWISTLLLALICFGPIAYRLANPVGAPGGAGGRGRSQAAIAVEVAPIECGTIRDVLTLTGSLRPRSSFQVAAKVPGRLRKLHLDSGDTVARGQRVAELDSEEYKLLLDQAAAEVRVAEARLSASQAQLDLANRELERNKTLASRNLVSDSELDSARGRKDASAVDAQVNVSLLAERRAAMQVAELRYRQTMVQALWESDPPARVVGERYVDEGSLLQANAPILSVLDLSELVAEVFVIEREYERLRQGMHVEISTDAYRGTTFPASVLRVAPLLQESSRQAKVELLVPNPGSRLKPGMFVRARIEVDRHDGVPLVPRSAVTQRDGESGVFLLEEGEATLVRFLPTPLGILSSQRAELGIPCRAGRVVTLGHHLLRDGAPILPVEPGVKPAKAAGAGRGRAGESGAPRDRPPAAAGGRPQAAGPGPAGGPPP